MLYLLYNKDLNYLVFQIYIKYDFHFLKWMTKILNFFILQFLDVPVDSVNKKKCDNINQESS